MNISAHAQDKAYDKKMPLFEMIENKFAQDISAIQEYIYGINSSLDKIIERTANKENNAVGPAERGNISEEPRNFAEKMALISERMNTAASQLRSIQNRLDEII